MLDETKEYSKLEENEEVDKKVKKEVKTSKNEISVAEKAKAKAKIKKEVTKKVEEPKENSKVARKKEEKEKDSESKTKTKVKPKAKKKEKETEKVEEQNTEDKEDVKTSEKKSEKEVADKDEAPISEKIKESDKKETKPKQTEFPLKDYKAIGLEELVEELEILVNDSPINRIKNNVEAIKTAFNSKFSTLLADKKEAFIKEGGNSIDFYFSSPYKAKYNALLGQFKKKRSQFYNQLEQELNENLKIKLDIIDALKELIDNAEVGTMYNAFKALQERWRAVGAIPRNKYNDTWQTYHHHVERFYDLLHLSKDLRDLDFKHNLEEKEKLIKMAEALNEVENIDVAFKNLQELHKIWKEGVGPVQKEIREEVWQRFSRATKIIHDRRHEAFKELKVSFDDNATKKDAIITEISIFSIDDLHSHSDWQNAIRQIEKLRDDFFKIGRVSRKQNEALWKKFKEATRTFNSNKNDFYKNVKKEQLDNLTKKRALLSQAQSLKDNEDIETTVVIIKKIQADWKNIGHVPRKYSDKIWKEFKDACNHFFDRYHASQNEDSKEEAEAFNKKKAYLDDLKSKAEKKDIKPSLEEVKLFIKEWKNLGFVSSNMRHIETKFNKFLEKQLEGLKLGKSELVMLKFKIMIDSYKAANDSRRIDSEQIFLRKKMDETTREMQQLDNNMNFFSNTSDDNPLLKKVKKDIKKHQENLVILKEKLGYIRRA